MALYDFGCESYKTVIIDGCEENVPVWANWLAFDEDGECYAYELKPEPDHELCWWGDTGGKFDFVLALTNICEDWENSLIELK